MMEKSTETAEPSSWKLMNSRPTTVETPGPLYVGDSCEAWTVRGSLAVGPQKNLVRELFCWSSFSMVEGHGQF